jgi:hypothetical protein
MATVEIEIASEVECVVCGAKKFSMFAPYVCHRCWKNGNAAKLIVLLQESGTTQLTPDKGQAAVIFGEKVFAPCAKSG